MPTIQSTRLHCKDLSKVAQISSTWRSRTPSRLRAVASWPCRRVHNLRRLLGRETCICAFFLKHKAENVGQGSAYVPFYLASANKSSSEAHMPCGNLIQLWAPTGVHHALQLFRCKALVEHARPAFTRSPASGNKCLTALCQPAFTRQTNSVKINSKCLTSVDHMGTQNCRRNCRSTARRLPLLRLSCKRGMQQLSRLRNAWLTYKQPCSGPAGQQRMADLQAALQMKGCICFGGEEGPEAHKFCACIHVQPAPCACMRVCMPGPALPACVMT
eukprot:1159208-Pelagomonas_calceolata.AAC.10